MELQIWTLDYRAGDDNVMSYIGCSATRGRIRNGGSQREWVAESYVRVGRIEQQLQYESGD